MLQTQMLLVKYAASALATSIRPRYHDFLEAASVSLRVLMFLHGQFAIAVAHGKTR